MKKPTFLEMLEGYKARLRAANAGARRAKQKQELVHMNKGEVSALDRILGHHRDIKGTPIHTYGNANVTIPDFLKRKPKQRNIFDKIREMGRGGDTEMVLVPRSFAELLDHIIHHGRKQINPNTGLREYAKCNVCGKEGGEESKDDDSYICDDCLGNDGVSTIQQYNQRQVNQQAQQKSILPPPNDLLAGNRQGRDLANFRIRPISSFIANRQLPPQQNIELNDELQLSSSENERQFLNIINNDLNEINSRKIDDREAYKNKNIKGFQPIPEPIFNDLYNKYKDKIVTQLGNYIDSKGNPKKNSLSCGVATYGNILNNIDKKALANQDEYAYPLAKKAARRAFQRNLQSWELPGNNPNTINFPLDNIRNRLIANTSLDKHYREVIGDKQKRKIPSLYSVNDIENLEKINKLSNWAYNTQDNKIQSLLYQPKGHNYLHYNFISDKKYYDPQKGFPIDFSGIEKNQKPKTSKEKFSNYYPISSLNFFNDVLNKTKAYYEKLSEEDKEKSSFLKYYGMDFFNDKNLEKNNFNQGKKIIINKNNQQGRINFPSINPPRGRQIVTQNQDIRGNTNNRTLRSHSQIGYNNNRFNNQ